MRRLDRSTVYPIAPQGKRFHAATCALVLALTMSAACSKREAEDATPTVSVQVAVAVTKTIERKVTTEGVIYPLQQAALVPKVTAPVRRVFVERGSHVYAGQLLAQLEDQDLAAAVTDTKGIYEQAQATYETTTRQSLPEEIRKAELDARAADEGMQVAQKIYASQQNLFAQGATARKNVDDANLAYIQARNQYDLAAKHVESLKHVGREQEIKAANGQLASARGKYQGAEAQLNFAEIRSPIDGVVTDRPLYAGETAAAGVPLITVMDISHIIVRAHIDQTQAAVLKVGDAAFVSAPSIPDPLPGEVTMVSPALDPGSTTVEVWVEATNPGEQLRPGGSATLAIVAQTIPGAIVIPAGALLSAPDGGTTVVVADVQNKPIQKTVKVGIRDGDDAQIVEGLHTGERVVTVGAFDLSKEDPDVFEKTALIIEAPSGASHVESDDPGSQPKTTGEIKNPVP